MLHDDINHTLTQLYINFPM